MVFQHLTVGPLMVNCYVLGDEVSGEAVVIDPGGDALIIFSVLKNNGLTLKYIINTHGHFDHSAGAGPLKKLAGGQILIHELEEQQGFEPDDYLKDGDKLIFGDFELEVIETPGHSPGGVSIYFEEAGMVFAGDTLFARSVGRTDIPGSSSDVLVKSIREKLFKLPDDTMVLPGHGSRTAVDWEKQTNPYVRGES